MLAQWLFIIEGRPLVGSKASAHLIFGKGKEKNVADTLHAVIKLIMLPNASESKNSFCIIYGLQRHAFQENKEVLNSTKQTTLST